MDNKGTEKLDLNILLKITLFRFISALIIVSIILFIAKFWNAWLFIMLLFIPSSIALTYMFRRDPKLLEKRMRTKEKEKTQKLII